MGKLVKLLPPIITLLRPKCTNFDFVSATGGSYSVPPDPLPVFKGPTSNGKNGRGRTTGKVQGGEEKEERDGGRHDIAIVKSNTSRLFGY